MKVEYGIDLGTTNSSLSRMENGKPTIKKSDTLKDTMPSCLYFNRKKTTMFGDSAYNAMKREKLRAMLNWDKSTNAFTEFKRTMGSDKKYFIPNMERSFTSEELSAEVLKTLKSFVIDDEISSIIITIPAQFTINQKVATMRASEIAGFKYTELLSEPIAASFAYGLDTKNKNGSWLVFDFGGGTFDAALLKVEEGILKVIDTDGDNWLGGKNIDEAIVDEIIIPYFEQNYSIKSIMSDEVKKEIFRSAMKSYAEESKIQLSFRESYSILSQLGDIPGEDDNGEEFELDLTITIDEYAEVARPFFQRAIDLSQILLKRNGLTGDHLETLLLVGGPTHSPFLRSMLKEQITKPDTSMDPMTVVACGAALYASTIDIPENIQDEKRDVTKLQLKLGYESTTIEDDEQVTISIQAEKNDREIPEEVFVELVRDDKAWSSGKKRIEGMGEIIEVKLNSNTTNLFEVKLYDSAGDRIECEPDSFTIIQGAKVLSSILSNNIGIAIKSKSTGEEVFTVIEGLEKNKRIPVTGVNRVKLITQKRIRPGIKEDIIRIPVLEGKFNAEGSNPLYNLHVFDAVISGADIPALLPEGSEVNLTIKYESDGKIHLSVDFPLIDHTETIGYDGSVGIQKDIKADWLETELEKSKQKLQLIVHEDIVESKEELQKLQDRLVELEKRLKQGRGDYDRKQEVLENLRESCRRIDQLHEETKWPKIEEELKNVYYQLEKSNQEFGNDRTTEIVEEFKRSIPSIIKSQNIKLAQEVIDDMRSLGFTLIDKGMGVQLEISLLHQFRDEFDIMDWSDKNKAKYLIGQGFHIAANNPTKEKLRPILHEIYALLPDSKEPMALIDDTLLEG